MRAFEHVDRIPVTLLVAVAYVTLAIATEPFHPTAETLEKWGWLTPALAADGEAWRMLASAFLHGGILHLLFNLSMLVSVGPGLEQSLGSARFAVLYVVSALGGSIGVCLLYEPFQPVVGGSGALFGMLGGLVAMNMRAGRHLFSFLDFEGPRRLLGTIVANLLIGFLLPFISNTAHIAGLLAGFGVTFLWLRPERRPSPAQRQWRVATGALAASLLFAALVPVARYDWLWNRAVPAGDTDRATRLRRAAAMSYYGLPEANDDDVERFYREVVERRGG